MKKKSNITKKSLYMLFIVMCLFSCNNMSKQESLQKEENIKIVKSMYDAFNKHDWEDFANHFKDPLTVLDPSYGQNYVQKSNADLVNKYTQLNAWSPDVQDSVVAIYAEKDVVIVEFISYGTTSTGQKWQLPICSVYHLENGKIVKDATYFDQ